ncbi:MAG: hypothetical protein MJE68_25330, partial [Proteobacteria bacterium]|nr:hypothetical protein [Pseudomonadota bacterium]
VTILSIECHVVDDLYHIKLPPFSLGILRTNILCLNPLISWLMVTPPISRRAPPLPWCYRPPVPFVWLVPMSVR